MTGVDERELPPDLTVKVMGIGEQAYAALDAGEFAKARRLFLDAFELLPEPRYEWAVGEPLLADAAYSAILEGHPKLALHILRDGLAAPVMNSPKINLRIGQALFELEEKEKAAGHFLFALLGGGKELFSEEEPEYYAFACEAVKPPTDYESWDDYEPPDEWPPENASDWFELKLSESETSPRRAFTPLGKVVVVGLAAFLLWLLLR